MFERHGKDIESWLPWFSLRFCLCKTTWPTSRRKSMSNIPGADSVLGFEWLHPKHAAKFVYRYFSCQYITMTVIEGTQTSNTFTFILCFLLSDWWDKSTSVRVTWGLRVKKILWGSKKIITQKLLRMLPQFQFVFFFLLTCLGSWLRHHYPGLSWSGISGLHAWCIRTTDIAGWTIYWHHLPRIPCSSSSTDCDWLGLE